MKNTHVVNSLVKIVFETKYNKQIFYNCFFVMKTHLRKINDDK